MVSKQSRELYRWNQHVTRHLWKNNVALMSLRLSWLSVSRIVQKVLRCIVEVLAPSNSVTKQDLHACRVRVEREIPSKTIGGPLASSFDSLMTHKNVQNVLET